MSFSGGPKMICSRVNIGSRVGPPSQRSGGPGRTWSREGSSGNCASLPSGQILRATVIAELGSALCELAPSSGIAFSDSRCSARSRSKNDLALSRAMRRKALLREGVTTTSPPARKWSKKEIKERSALCGVAISDKDASSLSDFILANA